MRWLALLPALVCGCDLCLDCWLPLTELRLLLLGLNTEPEATLVAEWLLSDRVAKETGVECISKFTYIYMRDSNYCRSHHTSTEGVAGLHDC